MIAVRVQAELGEFRSGNLHVRAVVFALSQVVHPAVADPAPGVQAPQQAQVQRRGHQRAEGQAFAATLLGRFIQDGSNLPHEFVHDLDLEGRFVAGEILAPAHEVELAKPLVVRLAGTNVEQGKKIMANSGLTIIPADDLGDAAAKIVNAVKVTA